MKVPPTTLEAMRDAIAPLDTPTVRGAYLRGEFPRAELVKDLDRRYRWDLLRAALPASWICAELYDAAGCQDSHIDTALRTIVPPLVDA